MAGLYKGSAGDYKYVVDKHYSWFTIRESTTDNWLSMWRSRKFYYTHHSADTFELPKDFLD